jgi:hypothetical protein
VYRGRIRADRQQQRVIRNAVVQQRIAAHRSRVSSNTRSAIRARLDEQGRLCGVRSCQVNLGRRVDFLNPVIRRADSPMRPARPGTRFAPIFRKLSVIAE